MSDYHFEPFTSENGTVLYHIVNEVTRYMAGLDDSILYKGSRGGIIEHPELVDPDCSLWIDRRSRVMGETRIEGACVIRNASIRDCTLRGSIVIGSRERVSWETDAGMDSFYPCRVLLLQSDLDSEAADPSGSFEEDVRPVIRILDRSYIKGCSFLGPSDIRDRPHLLNCHVSLCRIDGQPFLSGSELTDDTWISDSCHVTDSTLRCCQLCDDASVMNSRLWHRVLRYHDAVYDNRFLKNFTGTGEDRTIRPFLSPTLFRGGRDDPALKDG